MKSHSLLLLTTISFFSLMVGILPADANAEPWKPAESAIMTTWGEKIDPENVLPEYPRPQMVRENWQNLNGIWSFAITPRETPRPEKMNETILVPFPVESALSGVKKSVTAKDRLWYSRTFTVPAEWKEQRVLLHFGAVDWEADVYINGRLVGSHSGGYSPFSFDITDALQEEGEQELVVSVWDPTSEGDQPVGKQITNPHGIWYTPVSGIWQTVWLEPAPARSIVSFELVPDIDAETLTVKPLLRGEEKDCTIKVTALDEGKEVASAEAKPSEPVTLPIKNPKLWSPANPFLYDLRIELFHKENQTLPGEPVDVVKSYFGMRKISVAKDKQGTPRLCLNNKPLFQFGPLDQGWWPDGLYTAPTDDALIYDIDMTKKLGMNMIRKHVKVEPARWYYHCDRLGMLVWQDMPSKTAHRPLTNGHLNFRKELIEMIESRQASPCIVMWVPYNEGWGQYQTEQVTALVKLIDPTRLVDNASGWVDKKVGDVLDIHVYPNPEMPTLEETRAAVIGEFGGLGLPVEGHLWQQQKNWGYRSYENKEAYNDMLNDLIAKLAPMVKDGVAAAVYTQTSDVEVEVNGIMTYDRKVIKVDVDRFRQNVEKLYEGN